MTLSTVLYLITYLGIAAFLIAVVTQFLRFQKMPLHLRWELYPVAHEPGNKAKYGGSMLEHSNWWKKPQESSKFNELKVMLPEMLFLAALFEHNRKLWWRSFPFHFGLYILSATIGLIFLGTLMELGGTPLSMMEGFGSLVYSATPICMAVGLALATLGAIGLLSRRLFDEDLKDYTFGADIFNLVFFIVVLGVSWASFLTVDKDFALTRTFFGALVTFNLSTPVESPLLLVQLFLSMLIIAYIPMTHMAHFFLKWFTWHGVRWDDRVNTVGSDIEKKVMEQVQYPVSWSAPHLKADGKKNWVDIATEDIE